MRRIVNKKIDDYPSLSQIVNQYVDNSRLFRYFIGVKREIVNKKIDDFLSRHQRFSSQEFAAHLGISRQGAHRHLRRLLEEGVLLAEGKARARRYTRKVLPTTHTTEEIPHGPTFCFRRAGLEEHRVWQQLKAKLSFLKKLNTYALQRVEHGFLEMLNNAIEHSESDKIDISFWTQASWVQFSVRDFGIGAFENIRRTFEFDSLMEALIALEKGKTTTAPKAHSGEGIFFTSKMARLYILESNGLRWTVDNERNDIAWGHVENQKGTLVIFQSPFEVDDNISEIYKDYTTEDNQAFRKTRFRLKLLSHGTKFISRSEARRLMHDMEKFEHIVLDFKDVAEVGQGFIDEVFRVWAGVHPEVHVEAVNMNDVISFMVRRGQTV